MRTNRDRDLDRARRQLERVGEAGLRAWAAECDVDASVVDEVVGGRARKALLSSNGVELAEGQRVRVVRGRKFPRGAEGVVRKVLASIDDVAVDPDERRDDLPQRWHLSAAYLEVV